MNIDTLTALSPLDGRYQQKLQKMANVFSEKSLIWHRLWVEIRWLRFLSQHQDISECPIFPQPLAQKLDTLLDQFSPSRVCNHLTEILYFSASQETRWEGSDTLDIVDL